MNAFYTFILSAFLVPSTFMTNAIDLGVDERHQAMYLVNLVRNIDWQGQSITTIGIIGESEVTPELEALVKRNSKISVRTFTDLNHITECDILYLPNASISDFYLTQNAIADLPILLVVDKKTFVERGAEIGFYIEEGKLKVGMNQVEIKKTGIKISQALMIKAASFSQ